MKVLTNFILFFLFICLIPLNYMMFTAIHIKEKIFYLVIILVLVYLISFLFNKFFFYHLLNDKHKDIIFTVRKVVATAIVHVFMGLFMFLIMYNGLSQNLENDCNEFILTEYHDCIKINGVMDCTNMVNTTEFDTNYIDFNNIEGINE